MRKAGTVITQSWLTEGGAAEIMAALTARGGTARFVGGCVRDALAGRAVRDIDIATDQRPETVMALLKAAKLRAIPTGIDHGTVTAVAHGNPFEVTTLRVDVETDGRRAVVAFTDDWTEDARRRDFTFNALYCDPDGAVYDPVGGVDDLNARHVRFIGDPYQRIEEDALRILRFFRFHAWYGDGPMNEAGLGACRDRRGDLARLSVERIRAEMLRLLEAPSPVTTLRVMAEAGILAEVMPESGALQCLERLVEIGEDDALVRLASLTGRRATVLAGLAERWKLSNGDRARLRCMAAGEADIPASLTDAEARTQLYWLGMQRFRDLALLDWADDGNDRRHLLALADAWRAPAFPVRGADLLREGIPAGEQVGKLLRALERQWVDEGFEPGKAELLARIETLE